MALVSSRRPPRLRLSGPGTSFRDALSIPSDRAAPAFDPTAHGSGDSAPAACACTKLDRVSGTDGSNRVTVTCACAFDHHAAPSVPSCGAPAPHDEDDMKLGERACAQPFREVTESVHPFRESLARLRPERSAGAPLPGGVRLRTAMAAIDEHQPVCQSISSRRTSRLRVRRLSLLIPNRLASHSAPALEE